MKLLRNIAHTRFTHILCGIIWFLSTGLHAGFSCGTQIMQQIGTHNICDAGINTRVLSKTKDGNSVGRVVCKHTICAEWTVTLWIGNTPITTDPQQAFYIPAQEAWKTAQNLRVGDRLLNCWGNSVAITNIQYQNKQQTMHDLTVEWCHNYFVSEQGVLAHNELVITNLSCIAGGPTTSQIISTGIGITLTAASVVYALVTTYPYLVKEIFKIVFGSNKREPEPANHHPQDQTLYNEARAYQQRVGPLPDLPADQTLIDTIAQERTEDRTDEVTLLSPKT